MQGAQIQPLIRELKSCKPHGVARGKKGTAEMTIGTKKKLNVNTYDSMNGPWGHYAKWNKPVTKTNTVWFTLTRYFSSVQFSRSVVSDFLWPPWITARQASLSITNSQSSPKLMCIESVMPSSHLILCRPLLLPPPIPPSIRVFSNESSSHQVTKLLEFQLQHQSFQWTPRTDLL